MNCTHCHKPVVLIPSAAERAKKFGGTADFYTRLFTVHVECQLARNKEQVTELMKKTHETQKLPPT